MVLRRYNNNYKEKINMKVEVKVLGYELSVELPYNSVEEFDSLAGKKGACLERATQNFMAHTHNARMRKAMVEKLEEVSGIKRESSTDEDGKNVKYTETEQAYVSRVEAQLMGTEEWANIRAEVTKAAQSVPVALETIREFGPNKQMVELARGLINEGRVDDFIAKHNLTLDTDWSNEENVKALAVEVKRIVEEAKKAALL